MQKEKLSKPINKDGNEISSLNFDFDKLTGRQIISAESEARLLGDKSTDLQFSKTFQAVLAAKAIEEPLIIDDILDLPAPDFLVVTNTVSNFLFGWVLENLREKQSGEQQ
ncbi:MAG: Mu-like prophage FluMu protein gp41 [Firmicutes bacterium]|nr:Mu-like prophage FluMu protein gp41 [Bacillota bacterium]